MSNDLFNFQRNATDLGEVKVLRGMKNYKDLAHVIQFNGDDGNDIFL